MGWNRWRSVTLALTMAVPTVVSARAQAQDDAQKAADDSAAAAQPGKHEGAEAAPDTAQKGNDASKEAAGGAASKMHCEEIGRIIEFKVGDASLSPSAKQVLSTTASWATDAPDRGVRLEGAADKSGPTSLNEQLSQERAQSAKEYLTQQGVDPDKIKTEALGENPDRPMLEGLRAVEIRNCSAPMAAAPAAEQPAPTVVEVNPPPAPPPEVEPVPVVIPVAPAPKSDKPMSGVGVGIALGGGATGFAHKDARDLTNIGGSWEARAAFGTRLPLALEGAYVGSAQDLNALGLDRNALLVGNGAEGDLRLNLGTLRVQPYLFGGAGWTHYTVERNNNATSSITTNADDVFTVPAGAGLSFRLGRGFLIDFRGTYRWVMGANMLNPALNSSNTSKSPSLTNWNAGGHLGWEF
jgi:outer membrane protein OmpA-like peptidoglycan-associated protein